MNEKNDLKGSVLVDDGCCLGQIDHNEKTKAEIRNAGRIHLSEPSLRFYPPVDTQIRSLTFTFYCKNCNTTCVEQIVNAKRIEGRKVACHICKTIYLVNL
jgi:hypothetical protein